MNQDKSLKSMDSMMNVAANTAIQMFGNVLLNSLISFPSLLLLKISSSAYMEVFLQALKLLITSEHSKDSKKFHMKDLCAISFGQILMIEQDGE